MDFTRFSPQKLVQNKKLKTKNRARELLTRVGKFPRGDEHAISGARLRPKKKLGRRWSLWVERIFEIERREFRKCFGKICGDLSRFRSRQRANRIN